VPVSSRILTAKIVLEKLNANEINRICSMVRSEKAARPIVTPDHMIKLSKTMVMAMCTLEVSQICGFRSCFSSNLRPIVNKRRITPKLAIPSISALCSTPKYLRTKPAARKPTRGGRPIRFTRYPKPKAQSNQTGSILRFFLSC